MMLLEVLKESLPTISTLLTAGAAGGAAGQNQKGLVASTAAPTTMNGGASVEAFDVQVKAALAYLKRKCLAGSDPGLYVDWVIENRDEAIYQHLIRSAVTQEFSVFVGLDAEIAKPPYEQFFRSIYDGLRQAFTSPDPVGGDSGGAHGDKANTNGHGGTGKRGGK